MQDVSKILTRKYYGKKDPFRSREFRQPRWMELLAVLLFTVSGLGEGKSINAVLGGDAGLCGAGRAGIFHPG